MKDKGEQLLMASDDERHGFISGETFDLKPVRYYAVEEKDPDTGATITHIFGWQRCFSQFT